MQILKRARTPSCSDYGGEARGKRPTVGGMFFNSGRMFCDCGGMYSATVGKMFCHCGRMFCYGRGNVLSRWENVLPGHGNVLPRWKNVLPRWGNVLPRWGNALPGRGNVLPRWGNVVEIHFTNGHINSCKKKVPPGGSQLRAFCMSNVNCRGTNAAAEKCQIIHRFLCLPL